jgi:hypothetical protein
MGFLPLVSWSSRFVLGEIKPFGAGLFVGFHLFEGLSALLEMSFYFLSALYVSRQVYLLSFHREKFNLAKQNIFLMTFLVYGSLLWFANTFIFLTLVSFNHSLPYLILIFREERMRNDSLKRWRSFFFAHRLGILSFLGALALVSWIEMGFWSFHNTNPDEMVYRAIYLDIFSTKSRLLASFFTALFLTPVLSHFTLDAFVWRSKDVKALSTQNTANRVFE